MRLTMRTLLNWINENLSEEDAKLIAQKVEASDLAKALKAQIEEVLHMQDLPAPDMLDGTPLGNANSSADYLDNAMAPAQTPEYEKFCLHSEIRLGEVAACHRILSRALTAVLEISPELRAKLCALHQFADSSDEYSIPVTKFVDKIETIFDDILESEESEVPAAVLAAPAEKTPVKVSAKSPAEVSEVPSEVSSEEVPANAPNYWKWGALGGCGLLVLGLLAGMLMPSSVPGRMLGVLFGREPAPGIAPAPVYITEPAAAKTSQPAESAEFSKKDTISEDSADENDTQKPMNEKDADETPTAEDSGKTVSEAETDADSNVNSNVNAENADAANESDADISAVPHGDAENSEVSDDSSLPTEAAVTPDVSGDEENADAEENENAGSDKGSAIGKIEGNTLLLNAENALPGAAGFQSGETVSSLDGFYSTVRINGQLQLALTGASRFTVNHDDAKREVQTVLDFGRFSCVCSPNPKYTERTVIQFGNGSAVLSPGTRAAISVYRNRTEDPIEAERIVDIYLISGEIFANLDAKEVFTSEDGPLHIRWNGRSHDVEVVPELPSWTVTDIRPQAVREAADEILGEILDGEKAPLETLREFAGDKKWTGSRELALRCLCQLSDPEGIRSACETGLSRTRSRAEAARAILKNTLFLSPEHAKAVKKEAGELWKVLVSTKNK